MMNSHANIVALADRLRIDSDTRGELESMRKEVFAAISEGLKGMSSKSKNPWRLTRHEQFRTGSLYRETAMKGSSDIDVVLLSTIVKRRILAVHPMPKRFSSNPISCP